MELLNNLYFQLLLKDYNDYFQNNLKICEDEIKLSQLNNYNIQQI